MTRPGGAPLRRAEDGQAPGRVKRLATPFLPLRGGREESGGDFDQDPMQARGTKGGDPRPSATGSRVLHAWRTRAGKEEEKSWISGGAAGSPGGGASLGCYGRECWILRLQEGTRLPPSRHGYPQPEDSRPQEERPIHAAKPLRELPPLKPSFPWLLQPRVKLILMPVSPKLSIFKPGSGSQTRF
jgi:hypothetical protein